MRRARLLAFVLSGLVACTSFSGSGSDPATPAEDAGTQPEAGTDQGDARTTPADGGDAGAESDASDAADAEPPVDFVAAVRQLPGLVAYWRLDDDPKMTAVDGFGGNNGEYLGSVGPGAGLLPGEGDKGATLFGPSSTGSVHVGGGGKEHALSKFGAALTVGALVRLDSVGDRYIVWKDTSFSIGILASGAHPFLDVSRGGVNDARMISGVTVKTGDTLLIIGTFDASGNGTQTLWVNGQPTTVQGRNALSTSTDSTFCIGGYGADCKSADFPWNGAIDEVFVANQAASADTVARLTSLAGLSP